MTKCSECYDNPDFLYWQDIPMNEAIRVNLVPKRHAIKHYNTLNEALAEYGNQIEESDNEL